MSKSPIPTPHINAKLGDFAKTVLMPGDPLRAKYIAEHYLENPVLVNNVRGVQGYTGTYKGKRVSVMASGMGIPSIGIYSYELFNFYGVESIIRIGSAGGLGNNVNLRDVVIAVSACTNSRFVDQFKLPGTFAPTASYEMVEKAVNQAKKMGISYKVGSIVSNDTFYEPDMSSHEKWRDMGVLAVEMEAAGLYTNAAACHKKALAICTISDIPLLGEGLSAEDRQNTFNDMMILALEIAEE